MDNQNTRPGTTDNNAPWPAGTTWLDLVPARHRGAAQPQITREEVCRQVCARGYRFSERTMRDWEYRGVLPAPVYVTDRDGRRALYPHWYSDVVALVYRERHHPRPRPLLSDLGTFAQTMIEVHAAGNRLVGDDLSGLPPALAAELWNHVRSLTAPVAIISLTLCGPDGRVIQELTLGIGDRDPAAGASEEGPE